jgi:amidase
VADEDLMFRPALELAGMVRAGEISARELVQISLERIEELNPALNAFAQVDAERALATADAVRPGDTRPFAGVPIAIKNNRPVQGLRLTYGCPLMAENECDYDHNVTRRLKHAGFVIVGTTTLPEYGILPTSEARIFGPTRNPWDLGRTPGGSSGGAAAAVASGMLPVAHGNDGGGSIRIPAACCGLVGLKPSRGRVSCAPELGDSPLVIDGMLTRTVADTAAILDVLAGYEPGDATWAPPPAEPFARLSERDPGRLRIAATTLPPIPNADVDPVCARAVADAAALLRSFGHEVNEVDPPWQVDGLSELFGAVFSNHIALSIAYSGIVAGREPTAEDMEPMSWAIFSMIKKLGAIEGMAAAVQLQSFTRGLVAFLAPYDALLTPALAERPLPIGTLDTAAPEPMATFTRSGLFTPFTPVFNASGQPGISLPLFEGEDGLPLAVQLVGRPVGEGVLLGLAAQLEAAVPWAPRRPRHVSSPSAGSTGAFTAARDATGSAAHNPASKISI